MKRAFRIQGLDCAEEVRILKRELGPLVGEESLAFDILNGKLIVDASQATLSSADIVRAVARTGMRAQVWADKEIQAPAGFWEREGRTVLAVITGLFGLAGVISHSVLAGGVEAALGFEDGSSARPIPMPSVASYGLGVVTGLWLIFPKAWRAAVGLRPDMNLLMTLAILGAAAIGQWLEAVTVSFLFAVSLVLESWSVARARRAIAALLALAPSTARIREADGKEQEVPAADVSIGTVFVVRPSERIPLDGTVLRGASHVNQAPITGESIPAEKVAGSDVFAGTINGDGLLEVTSTKVATETTLAQIIRSVSEAQSRRAPSEQWVERFARIYTPVVMVLAAGVLLIPPLLLGGAWFVWLYRALVLLVIACPCALVISTPVSIVAALTAAARNGVLIKGGVYVEMPARLRAIAFDKTGTLTSGKPSLVEIVPLNGHDEKELLERAAALESHSNHPLAQAIVRAAQERHVTVPIADQFAILQGKGALGRINGTMYWLGSHRFLVERGQETPDVSEQLKRMQEAGKTVVVVGNDRHVCGFIALADAVRANAVAALERLRKLGVKRFIMLTGDNEHTARMIAGQLAIDEVHAELLPQDKVELIERLVTKHEHVAMIGDGVNDAPALARASLGVVMGAAGSDAAIETADVALMSDELSKLPWLIQHSRRTLAVIRQNIAFSLTVKLCFMLATCAGFASLWAAIAADTGASLLVIFNGLRLLRSEKV